MTTGSRWVRIRDGDEDIAAANMPESFPRMIRLRQSFPAPAPVDVGRALKSGFDLQVIRERLKPSRKIAVAAGSRGITNIGAIVGEIANLLKGAGCEPFIVPAMGSHGGATPEGQTELLAGYGITERRLGVPVRACLDVQRLGRTEDGVEVNFSAEALRADGIIVVNRVKPHTDFDGRIASGLMKMTAIGLGKRAGAAACHAAASRLGHERVIRTVARVALRSAPILCGVAILEGPRHETAHIEVIPAEEIEKREERLLVEAKKLMPKLPLDDIDLLIVDHIGKNISGAGMDPNIIGRHVQGYSSSLLGDVQKAPVIRRIFVRDLTAETHGNAIGIGLADITTSRLVRAVEERVTYINALTALTPQTAKIPIHFETDREAIGQALASLALAENGQPKIVRIADTLSLDRLEASEAYSDLIRKRRDLSVLGEPSEMTFDSSGNLPPMVFG